MADTRQNLPLVFLFRGGAGVEGGRRIQHTTVFDASGASAETVMTVTPLPPFYAHASGHSSSSRRKHMICAFTPYSSVFFFSTRAHDQTRSITHTHPREHRFSARTLDTHKPMSQLEVISLFDSFGSGAFVMFGATQSTSSLRTTFDMLLWVWNFDVLFETNCVSGGKVRDTSRVRSNARHDNVRCHRRDTGLRLTPFGGTF